MAKYIPRNPLALVARGRNGGPMKHRNTPRGGARNDQADLLAEAEEDTVSVEEIPWSDDDLDGPEHVCVWPDCDDPSEYE